MGEENHDLLFSAHINGGGKLWSVLRFLLQILPTLHFYSLHLVSRLTRHRGTVSSASTCEARGHGFEPGLKRYIFYSGKYPGAERACCFVSCSVLVRELRLLSSSMSDFLIFSALSSSPPFGLLLSLWITKPLWALCIWVFVCLLPRLSCSPPQLWLAVRCCSVSGPFVWVDLRVN